VILGNENIDFFIDINCAHEPFVEIVGTLRDFEFYEERYGKSQSLCETLNRLNLVYPWIKMVDSYGKIQFTSHCQINISGNSYFGLYYQIHRALADILIVLTDVEFMAAVKLDTINAFAYKYKRMLNSIEDSSDPILNAHLFHDIALKIDAEVYRSLESKGISTNSFGACHAIWQEKRSILLEKYKIIWRSPTETNPYIIYD
jgi:hypothetical protein